MRCTKCGFELQEHQKFCPKCGQAASKQDAGPTLKYSDPQETLFIDPYENEFREDYAADFYDEKSGRQKKESGNSLPLILGGCLILILIIGISVFYLFGTKKDDNSSAEETVEEVSANGGVEEEDGEEEIEVVDETVTPTAEAEMESEPAPEISIEPKEEEIVLDEQADAGQTPQAQQPILTEAPAVQTDQIAVQYGLYADRSEFIFPDSSTRAITYEEVEATCQSPDHNTRFRTAQLAINEILARYGFPFDPNKSVSASDAYNKYINSAWYQSARAQCPYGSYDEIRPNLNNAERATIDTICAWQANNDAEQME